jgi:hypothetical protein
MRAAATFAALVAFCLGGCAQSYPDGVVATRDQAVAIADRECGPSGKVYNGPWHVTLDGGWWLVSRTKGAERIDIDARTGQTSGCKVVG